MIHDAFHRPSTAIHRSVTAIVWFLILASIALLAIELALPEGAPVVSLLRRVDDVILGIFVVEVVLRVLSYRPPQLDFYRYGALGRLWVHIVARLRFCLTPLVMIDILTVLGSVPFLRGLRAIRLLRLLRSNQIFRYSNPFGGMTRAFEENRPLYIFGLSLLAVSVTLGGLMFFLTEYGHNDAIRSLPDALWWSIVTLTTVGYGDLTPATGLGKVVAGVLMVVGMMNLAVMAGIVGSTLMGSVLSMREESFRMSNYIDHVVICGYEPGTRLLLETLKQELDLERHTVVIFAPYERPSDVKSEFMWVQGDPTKESELDKVRLTTADSVIVVGSRSEMPQHADGRTILIAFTLRRYLKGKAEEMQRRQRPLHVVAEILDAENVEHAKTAGADEVIETTRIGFSLMAHAVEVPGTATLVGELADVSRNSLFVGRIVDVALPDTFRGVSHVLKERYNVLLIGVRGPGQQDQLNPSEDFELTSEHRVIYISDKAVLPV